MRTLLLLFLPVFLSAQADLIDFNPGYRFADGIYLSNLSLLANAPDVAWEDVAGEMVQLPKDYRVQVDGFAYKDGDTYRPPYAISLDGEVYFFVRRDTERDFHEFAGLRVKGPYGTLRYDTTVQTRQLMKAYNPATGDPFRQGWVERERVRTLERIVDLKTGRRFPFDHPTLMRLLAEERDLVVALEKVAPNDREKLIRALKIYAERRPLRLPATPPNR